MKKFNIAFFNLLSSTFIISFLLSNYVAKASTVTEVTYRSSTMGQNRQMMVYLPDGYDESKTYPTFYLVHGGGQDHRAWTVEGDAKGIIDRSIASGKSVPMIVVMPNVKDFAMDVFTKELCNDIIPYIESNYKAIAHKDRRALAGLSWGGLHALDAGLYRYDLFGYLGVYSSGWFLGDNIYNVMDQYLSEKGAEIEASMNYFYFGEGGRDDIAYENGMETMKLLRKHGLTVNYFEHSGSHSFVAWKQDLDAFLPFLFKDEITSVDEQLLSNEIKAYPNPFTYDVKLNFNSSYTYEIYSLTGKVMESGDFSSPAIGNSLLKGVYMLKVDAGNFIKNIKITKE